jgi:CheY-like chemotaxis protein
MPSGVRETASALNDPQEDARRAPRAEGEFIAKLSHELRTPLTAILGYTEILKLQSKSILPPDQFHHLEIIQRSGQAMLHLISAVLDWSRLESGRFEFEPQEFPVKETFSDHAETLVIMAAAKGLSFSLTFAENCRHTFVTDPHLVRQVFANLVTNAIKYTERGGVALEVACSDSELSFSVTDTGPGIPKQEHHRVFEEFQRLTPAAKDGTGLGLAITRGLVELLGGNIKLESELGSGCRFEVRLPKLIANKKHEEPLELPFPAAKKTATVLVVDDEPDNRNLIRHFLESEGMRVRVLEDGRNCVAEALQCSPDIVLMDMMMPGVDGFEATRQLRSYEGTRDLPVIALTALANAASSEKALAAGCNYCLTKPLDFRHLTNVIQHCLNSATLSSR